MSVRQRATKVFGALKNTGKQSIRKLSEILGFSKSSVDRQKKALERRNCHPESYLWETEEGHSWLHRFVFAVLYVFGIKGGIGAEQLSVFFKMIRLEKHFGVSQTALLTLMALG